MVEWSPNDQAGRHGRCRSRSGWLLARFAERGRVPVDAEGRYRLDVA
ncbi:MAG: hypothetical protein KatS3mg108_0428 [Isosphaeraceae bacterium]|jgi:hypothetical protein|nr:MAG: hypothetical protein KatS3mg108_0428 [Isosphaeraceae bacterium]